MDQTSPGGESQIISLTNSPQNFPQEKTEVLDIPLASPYDEESVELQNSNHKLEDSELESRIISLYSPEEYINRNRNKTPKLFQEDHPDGIADFEQI